MADIAQNTLLLVIIALSILLLILGIQVFFILKDFRQTLLKTSKFLDNANLLTEGVAASFSSLTSLAAAIKTGISLINFLKSNWKTNHSQTQVKQSSGDGLGLNGQTSNHWAERKSSEAGSGSARPPRRFFRGIGKKIHI